MHSLFWEQIYAQISAVVIHLKGKDCNYSSILPADADLIVLQWSPCIPLMHEILIPLWCLFKMSVEGLLPHLFLCSLHSIDCWSV